MRHGNCWVMINWQVKDEKKSQGDKKYLFYLHTGIRYT